jgi:hypothetical protein
LGKFAMFFFFFEEGKPNFCFFSQVFREYSESPMT